MSNALTFILKLQDLLTPAMRQAAGVSESAANKITSQFTGVQYAGKKMAASVYELRSALEQMNTIRFGTHIKGEFDAATAGARKLEKQIEKLENKGGEKSSSGGGLLSSIVGGNLIASGISMAGDALMNGAGSIISASVQQEQNKVGLKTFLGAGTDEAYNNIKKDAAVTPFDTQSLLMVNRALISAGLSAKDARRDAMNLGNAISAVGGGNDELSRMAVNMQQIKTVGKASAMDIKQFAFAGINIYKLLADATGKNIDQVKEMHVSYALLSKSLQHAAEKGGAYYGALDAQGKTVGGKWSTFMDNLKNTAADIGTALQPVFHWFLDMGIGITNSFSTIMPVIQPVIDVLNNIPKIMDEILSPTGSWSVYISLIKEYAANIWKTFKSLIGNVWHIVEGVVAWIDKSVLMKDLFWAISKIGEAILWSMRAIGDTISWLWDNIIKPILDKVEWVYSHIKGLFGGGKTTIEVVDGTIPKTAFSANPAFNGGGGAFSLYQPAVAAAVAVNPISLNSDRSSKITAKDMLGGDAKEKSSSINSGGQRSIIVNIGKQIEKLEVHVMDMKEGANEIESAVRETMRMVMYSINGTAIANG